MRNHRFILSAVIVCALIVLAVVLSMFERYYDIDEQVMVYGAWGSGGHEFGLGVSEEGWKYGPEAFAVARRGDRIAVADTFNSRLVLITAKGFFSVPVAVTAGGLGLCCDQVFVAGGNELFVYDWSGTLITSMQLPEIADAQAISRAIINFPDGVLISDLMLYGDAIKHQYWQVVKSHNGIEYQPIGTTSVRADGLRVFEGFRGNTIALVSRGVVAEDVTGDPTVRMATRSFDASKYSLSISPDVKAVTLKGSDKYSRLFMRLEMMAGNIVVARYPKKWKPGALVSSDWRIVLGVPDVIMRVDTQIDMQGSVYHASTDSSGYSITRYTPVLRWRRSQ